MDMVACGRAIMYYLQCKSYLKYCGPKCAARACSASNGCRRSKAKCRRAAFRR